MRHEAEKAKKEQGGNQETKQGTMEEQLNEEIELLYQSLRVEEGEMKAMSEAFAEF